MITPAEIEAARRWWERLPEFYKGSESIWVLLAMYAKEAVSPVTLNRVPKGEHSRVLDKERGKA